MGDKGRLGAAPANHVTSYLRSPKHNRRFFWANKKGYEFTLSGLHRRIRMVLGGKMKLQLICALQRTNTVPTGQGGE